MTSWTFGTVRRAAAGLMAGALGVVVWGSGCSDPQDRYYCDDTGCYSCDGYGCSSVQPPSATACTGASQCATGEVCTSAGCVKSCQQTSDCPRGTTCNGGACTAPGSDAGTPIQCTTKTDCTGQAVCIANQCQACGGTNGPCPCSANSDCSNGDVCSGGSCTAPSNTCQFSSDCGTGKLCADGQCVAGCTDSSTCGPNATCTKGVCEPNQGTQCTSDAQCSGSTPKCVSGSCVAACTTDADCGTGSGNYCNEGACVPDTRPKPICSDTDHSACNANQSCVSGFCRYSCTDDKSCSLIDHRIPTCVAAGYCAGTSTGGPIQCTQSSDCTGGKTCVDNTCR